MLVLGCIFFWWVIRKTFVAFISWGQVDFVMFCPMFSTKKVASILHYQKADLNTRTFTGGSGGAGATRKGNEFLVFRLTEVVERIPYMHNFIVSTYLPICCEDLAIKT